MSPNFKIWASCDTWEYLYTSRTQKSIQPLQKTVITEGEGVLVLGHRKPRLWSKETSAQCRILRNSKNERQKLRRRFSG